MRFIAFVGFLVVALTGRAVAGDGESFWIGYAIGAFVAIFIVPALDKHQ